MKGRINLMGGLRNSDKKRFVDVISKGDSDNFYKVLKIFYQELIYEWVEAGNQALDFEEKGPKIVIILDNASFHKKEEYLKKLKQIGERQLITKISRALETKGWLKS